MRTRRRTYHLLVLVLNAVLLGPVLPWSALRTPDGQGPVCHHMTCPHKRQHCTCHEHGATPLWQRCHEDARGLSGGPAMPYGPLPPAPVLLPVPAEGSLVLSDASPFPFRHTVDIFHPPR
ncbi:MAG: hypothetical protein Q9M35_04690 [Rhodothermus sp.]|nr:hypothetical protein [Rhodothermus sp.]